MVSSVSYVGGGINTGTITAVPPTFALNPLTSVSPYMSLAPPNPLSLPETRVNAWESVHSALRGMLGFHAAFLLTEMDRILGDFYIQMLWELPFLALVF